MFWGALMMNKEHKQKAACQLHWRRLPKRNSVPEKTVDTHVTRPQLGWGREDRTPLDLGHNPCTCHLQPS